MWIIDAVKNDPILSNIAANAIWVVLAGIALWGRRWLGRVARLDTVSLRAKWTALIIPAVAAVAIDRLLLNGSGLFGALAGTIVLATFGYVILTPLSKAGILGAVDRTSNGIDFDQSLRLVQSSFDFLGVGADKLTKSGEFEGALIRASRGSSPVRLLLSPPTNPILQQAANRAGLNPKEYQDRVKASLGRLRAYKVEKGYNLEVRFYSANSTRDYQQFRLMFIDHFICLVSYTVWDKGDGKDNPQLVLQAVRGDRSRQLISAFSDYFQRIWDDPSTEVADLSKFK